MKGCTFKSNLWCISFDSHILWGKNIKSHKTLLISELKTSLWAKSLQSCLTLYDPVDCIPPGSSVSGILQARIQPWAAMPFSRGSSPPREQTSLTHKKRLNKTKPNKSRMAVTLQNIHIRCRMRFIAVVLARKYDTLCISSYPLPQ